MTKQIHINDLTEANLDKAITLRKLVARLTKLLEENEATEPMRNDLPMVVRIHQAPTPKGRSRPEVFVPIANISRAMVHLNLNEVGADQWVKVLELETPWS